MGSFHRASWRPATQCLTDIVRRLIDGDNLPSEDDELEDLALNRHLGYITEQASELLMQAIGQRGSSRGAVVRQAIAVAMAEAS